MPMAAAMGVIVVLGLLFLLAQDSGQANLEWYIDRHYLRLPHGLLVGEEGWTRERYDRPGCTEIRYDGYYGGFGWAIDIVSIFGSSDGQYPKAIHRGKKILVSSRWDIRTLDRAIQVLEPMLPADKSACRKHSAWKTDGVPANQRWEFHSDTLHATYIVTSDEIEVLLDKGAELPDL